MEGLFVNMSFEVCVWVCVWVCVYACVCVCVCVRERETESITLRGQGAGMLIKQKNKPKNNHKKKEKKKERERERMQRPCEAAETILTITTSHETGLHTTVTYQHIITFFKNNNIFMKWDTQNLKKRLTLFFWSLILKSRDLNLARYLCPVLL